MKKILEKETAMLRILQGKIVKVDLSDCVLEAKRSNYGLFELKVRYNIEAKRHINEHIEKHMEEYIEVVCSSDYRTEFKKEFTYLSDFKGLMRSLNGVLGNAEFYIEG